jgi:hypothetical protein
LNTNDYRHELLWLALFILLHAFWVQVLCQTYILQKSSLSL